MTLFSFTDGLLFSILSICIVILLISLIILAISPLQRLSKNIQTNTVSTQESVDTNTIEDEDMMVAALVAAIEYRETMNKEPYLKSIKEIKNENL